MIVACDYVMQGAENRYYAGGQCKKINNNNKLSLEEIKKTIYPFMEELSKILEEAINFTVINNCERKIVALIESKTPIKVDENHLDGIVYKAPSTQVLLSWSTLDIQMKFIKKMVDLKDNGII